MKYPDLNIIDLIKIWLQHKKKIILITAAFTSLFFFTTINTSRNYNNVFIDFNLKNSYDDKINELKEVVNIEKKKAFGTHENQKNIDIPPITSSERLWKFYEIFKIKLLSNNIYKDFKPKLIKNEFLKDEYVLRINLHINKKNYTTPNVERFKEEIVETDKIMQMQIIEEINNLQKEYIKFFNGNLQNEIRKLELLIIEKKIWRKTNEEYFMDNKGNININNLSDKIKTDTVSAFLSVTALENRKKNLEQMIDKPNNFVLNEFEENKKIIQNNGLINYSKSNLFQNAPPSYKDGYLFHIFFLIISFCLALIITTLIHFYKKNLK
jgi:hypothetical protein